MRRRRQTNHLNRQILGQNKAFLSAIQPIQRSGSFYDADNYTEVHPKPRSGDVERDIKVKVKNKDKKESVAAGGSKDWERFLRAIATTATEEEHV